MRSRILWPAFRGVRIARTRAIFLRRSAPLIVIITILNVMFTAPGCDTLTLVPEPVFELTPTYATVTENDAELANLRRDAIAYLQTMTGDEYALYRANSIEALQKSRVEGERAARQALLDENLGVRFVSAMSIGLQRYSSSAALTHELLRDPDDSVRAAAIYALRRNGYNADVSPLAEMLKEPLPRTRSNAAFVLGELGDSSAIPMLREALNYDAPRSAMPELRVTQLQIAEALMKLGDDTAITRVRAHLFADDPTEGETRALAAQILGRAQDRRSHDYLVSLVSRWREYEVSAEVRLAAMEALTLMGEPPPIELVVEYLGPEYAEAPMIVRAQAVHLLGEIGTMATVPYLAQMFRETDETLVRIHAAAALLGALPAPESAAAGEREEVSDFSLSKVGGRR